MGAKDGEVLLEVKNLKKYFPLKKKMGEEQKYVKAVDDVSFVIHKGEALGLVGESGCGKSTLIRTILQILTPTDVSVRFCGQELVGMPKKKLEAERRNMQMVFQDPFASLPPKMRVGQILEEPLLCNGFKNHKENLVKIKEMMSQVGLSEGHIHRYAYEFSGGQRQRIVIARALVLKPKLVILDEPVSALDVSVRSQILNLLERLQKEMGLTYLFISHDLSVVEHLCDSAMVMYLGHIMERGSREQIFSHPAHPYTEALFSAIPSTDVEHPKERIILQGEIPSPVNPPQGCVLKTRCKYCSKACDAYPQQREVEEGHLVSCIRPLQKEVIA